MRTLLHALLVSTLVAPLPVFAADVTCGTDTLGRACPDLVIDPRDLGAPMQSTESFPSTHCAVIEGLVSPGTRALLRFPLAAANLGRAAVVLGHPAHEPQWFTGSTCHGHYHFDGFADYRLWTLEAYAAWAPVRAQASDRPASEVLAEHPDLAASMVAGRKQGFCLMDTEPAVASATPPAFPTCGYQGLSVGWQDRYDAGLDGQWIDVTDVPAGDYVLEMEVNPERRIEESDHHDNTFPQYVYIGT